jgi:hypothetical protein
MVAAAATATSNIDDASAAAMATSNIDVVEGDEGGKKRYFRRASTPAYKRNASTDPPCSFFPLSDTSNLIILLNILKKTFLVRV